MLAVSGDLVQLAGLGRVVRPATNIGETLNTACALSEQQNSVLQGVLAGDGQGVGPSRRRHMFVLSLRHRR